MSDVYKIIPILITIFIIIGLSLVFYFQYKKTPQPSKEDAYKKGLGYYTQEESLGCVNGGFDCTKPGEETFVQYCIPHPTTGRGCINLKGVETYDMSIRKKQCNIACHSQKFTVEDKVQVKNPGTLESSSAQVIGSGCNKVIDNKLGLDYTDFFFGDYDTNPSKPNTYDLKSCIPDDNYTGYYQKIFTCQANDPKGDNNCVYTCGSEGNILGLNGLFDSKLTKNLLKYFPSEIGSDGSKRYVCYDLNGVDQIEVLNYFNNVPTDFVYPNFCYKFAPVKNYNGDLWPNSDAGNVFQLPISNYQPKTKYFTVDGTSLNALFEEDGLVSPSYDIYKDYNSFSKVYLGEEVAILEKVMPLIDNNNGNLNLKYGNTPDEISTRDNSVITFYMLLETNSYSPSTNEPLYFDNSHKNRVYGFTYTGHDFNDDGNNFFEFMNITGSQLTQFSPRDKYNLTRNKINAYQFNANNSDVSPTAPPLDAQTYSLGSLGEVTPNPFIVASFLPESAKFFKNNNNSTSYTLQFSTPSLDSLNTSLTDPEQSLFYLTAGSENYYYVEVETQGVNYGLFFQKVGSASKNTNKQDGFESFYDNYSMNINIVQTSYVDETSVITSPIFVINNQADITFDANNESEFKLQLYQGQGDTKNTITIVLKDSFKTGNVRMNKFIETSVSDSNFSEIKYENSRLVYNYQLDSGYSLASAGDFTVQVTGQTTPLPDKINFVFKSKTTSNDKTTTNYTVSFLNINYIFSLNTSGERGLYTGWNIYESSDTTTIIAQATVNSPTNISISNLNGVDYTLTSVQPMITNTCFYVYGNNTALNDSNDYFWYPMVLTNDSNPVNKINFSNLSNYNFYSTNIIPNGTFPPSDTEEFTYLDFNEYSGYGNCTFKYGSISGNKFYIKNATRNSSLGNYSLSQQFINDNADRPVRNNLYLYNDSPVLSSNIGENFRLIDINDYILNEDDNQDLIIDEIDFNNQLYQSGGIINSINDINTLKVIRRESSYFNYNFLETEGNLTYPEQKIKEYMTMISGQNNGFSNESVPGDLFELILTPQSTVILAADYSVFKSPYKINEDGTYKFLCYNDRGVPLAKGTRVTLGENEKMYMNKSCTDYNTDESTTCGVIGVSASGYGTSVTPCVQERINQLANFDSKCIPYTAEKYNTIGNLYEQGILLKNMIKGDVINEEENSSANVFEDFFTREEEDNKSYKPNQELYINKNQQRFYLSLQDNNTDFVVEPSGWERVFTYQNLTKSVVYQNHLYTQNQITIDSSINLGLGNSTYTSYSIPGNCPYRMVFKNTTTGINTQNYFHSAVQFYFDTNNGSNYNNYHIGETTIFNSKSNPPVYFVSNSDGFVIQQPTNDTIDVLQNSYFYDSTNSETLTTVPQGGKIWDVNLIRARGIPLFSRGEFDSSTNITLLGAFSGVLSSTLDKIINSITNTTTLVEDPIYIDNINTYIASANVVTINTDSNKIENLIKFTITDNNLTKSYSDINVGDYVNIDSNFFGQLLYNLIGSTDSGLTQTTTLSSSNLNETFDKKIIVGNDEPEPELISQFRITSSRTLLLYSPLRFDTFFIENLSAITQDLSDKILKQNPINNKIIEITISPFGEIQFEPKPLPPETKFNKEDLVKGLTIEKFDILATIIKTANYNIYLSRVLDIKINKIGSEIISITYTIERDINNDFSEIPPDEKLNVFESEVTLNLKRGGSLINNFYKIIDITDNTFSFYFDIDNYSIESCIVLGGNPSNLIYDSTTVKTNGSFQNDQNESILTNTYNNTLSMRYIKQNVQIPYSKIRDGLFASMTRKNDIDYYDTKLLSYVTEYTFNNGFYYFKEFTEDYGYRNPQIEKSFKVGDVIEYLTKNNAGDYSNDAYLEERIAQFEIVSTTLSDCSIEVKDTYDDTTINATITYDYKCKLVRSFSDVNTSKPYNLSSNKVHLYNTTVNATTSTVASNVTSTELYHAHEDDNNNILYQLPYTFFPSDDAKREDMVIDGTVGTVFVYGKSTSDDDVYIQKMNFKDGRWQPIETSDDKYLLVPGFYVNNDYYKNLMGANIVTKTTDKTVTYNTCVNLFNNPAYAVRTMYPGNYIRGNRLDVLKLVSTRLNSVSDPTKEYITIAIEEMQAKPYGSQIILNNNTAQSLFTRTNYNRLGNVTKFSILNSNLINSFVGDVFDSGKGFQLILTEDIPSSYEFISIRSNSEINPYETQTGQELTPYDNGDVVSIIDRNTRQYFRNTSNEDSVFNFQLQKTSNFQIVPKTVYPQDNFVNYNSKAFYEKGIVVNYEDSKELSGLYVAEKSNVGVSVTSDENDFWSYDILRGDMKSNNQQFYSFVYSGETITQGDELSNIIKSTRRLNNSNLPLEIKTYNSDNEETDYCPKSCNVDIPSNKTIKQLIDESFVGQLPYFDNIRYLFENPVLVKQEGSQTYLTLGNVPVSYEKTDNYNVTYLSNSNNSSNLVSQFLYFLDLENGKKVYDKPECNQEYIHYDKNNPGGINTGVSSFDFSNSLLFQFIPCDLGSQDYISYGVGDNNLVTLNDPSDIIKWNRFPPVNGVTVDGGTSIALINGTSTNVFTGVSGTFRTSYITQNSKVDVGDYTLTGPGGGQVTINVTQVGNTLEGLIDITNNGTCYSYGDIWYLTEQGDNSILTYGFVVPDSDNGKLTQESFIQVKDFFDNPENCLINVSSETGTGFSMSAANGFQYISEYNLESLSGSTSGSYSGNGITVNVEFNGTDIVQPNQAIFTTSSTVDSGTSVYFPSYNVEENIKVKSLATFGRNYFGNIKYNNKGFKDMSNKVVPGAIFNIFTNSVFSNELADSNTVVLANNKNLSLNNLLDVIKINFKQDTFSMKLNNFSKPINDETSNLMQKNNINLGAINSNSVNVFISKEIKDVVGVSVRLSSSQIFDFNETYDPVNNLIPGNTNTQIQIREIRQNRTSDYIDLSNNCSLYFEPEIEPTKDLDGNSVFLSSDNRSDFGDTIQLTVTNQNPYTGSVQVSRFLPSFSTSIKYEPNSTISFYLGNNLTYYFVQTDPSNNGQPIVFSTSSGEDFFSNIITGLEQDITPGKIKFSYFLDFKEVTPQDYRTTSKFNAATQERKIIMMFETDYDITTINTNIYYGFNKTNGSVNGGLIRFIYH